MPRKKVVAIRHVAFENIGTLKPVLEKRGYEIQYCDIGVDSLAALSNARIGLLVVLGAPIGAYDDALFPFLGDEVALISQRLEEGLPTLGICLGAQLMARALGAQVSPMSKKEIGFAPLTLTAAGRYSVLQNLPADFPVLHWHGDQFEVPAGLDSLAQTPLCPNQAFSLGNYALAFQFHLEADTRCIEQWLIGHSVELLNNGIDLTRLRRQAEQHGEALRQAGETVIGAWLDELDFGQGA
ncbi:MAG: glutamine amidotransferase [Thiothrix sp.]|uniref:glutamine amidotransferase n=1 Tax=Thiothrix sp. TaxID=1032 RepID=UPI00262D5C5C|nr:glutamine amidotransferase [Thiothrix sp.]MDD5395129.1 glutamine amidotransferase [Thiothrix sp.]